MRRTKKTFALSMGIITHSIFLVAVTYMAFSIGTGFRFSQGHLNGISRVAGNFLLLLQFPLIHSILLSKRGRKLLSWPLPRMASTNFVLISSLDLLAIFYFYSHTSGPEFYLPTFTWVFFVASWLFLLRAMIDAGLALQTGTLGWVAEYKDKKPEYPTFRETGLQKYVRHPIYLGFLLILITGPIWNLDRVVILCIWGIYCVFGPALKEKRLLKAHGETYREYATRVPYLVPIPVLANFSKNKKLN